MGAILAEEILANRPPKPGPEWWLLLDLASDADDVTRLTACGFGYMEQRTHASRRTVYAWLRKLREDGLIRIVSHSRSGGRGGAKGERAVYEIQVPPGLANRVASYLDACSATRIRCNGGAPDLSRGERRIRCSPRLHLIAGGLPAVDC